MKSTFKIGNIEVQGVKLENVEFTQEYTASEAMELMNFGKRFVRNILRELPEIMEDLETAFNKVVEIEDRQETENPEETETKEEMPPLMVNGKLVKFEDLPSDLRGMVIHMMEHKRRMK